MLGDRGAQVGDLNFNGTDLCPFKDLPHISENHKRKSLDVDLAFYCEKNFLFV